MLSSLAMLFDGSLTALFDAPSAFSFHQHKMYFTPTMKCTPSSFGTELRMLDV